MLRRWWRNVTLECRRPPSTVHRGRITLAVCGETLLAECTLTTCWRHALRSLSRFLGVNFEDFPSKVIGVAFISADTKRTNPNGGWNLPHLALVCIISYTGTKCPMVYVIENGGYRANISHYRTVNRWLTSDPIAYARARTLHHTGVYIVETFGQRAMLLVRATVLSLIAHSTVRPPEGQSTARKSSSFTNNAFLYAWLNCADRKCTGV